MIDKLQIALDALNRLARLGNGGALGNSDGNLIAQKAIAEIAALEATQAQSEPYPAEIKKWPKRIWLQHGIDETRMPKYIEVCDGEEEVTWCQDHIEEFDIPYVRADLAAPVPAKPVVAWANNDGVQLRRTLNHVMSSEHGDWFALCRCGDVGVKEGEL